MKIECVYFFLLFVYGMTGMFISIKLFNNAIGKILGGFYFAIFWLPILIADEVVKRMEE